MNYIKRLEAENKVLKERLTATLADITAMRAFLCGPKFTGVDADGSRKDWISTRDVDRFLVDLGDKVYFTASMIEPTGGNKF